MMGVNLGAGAANIGAAGRGYMYPTAAEMALAARAKVLRIGLKFDNLRSPDGWAAAENHLLPVVAQALVRGQSVILNRHDFGKAQGRAITLDDVPDDVALWQKLLARWPRHTARVMIGAMNEPAGPVAAVWAYNQALVLALRAAGLRHRVLLPLYYWQKFKLLGDQAAQIAGFVDPANNHLIDVHHYFSRAGNDSDVDIDQRGFAWLADACARARHLGKRLAWTELSFPDGPTGVALVDQVRAFVAQNRDVIALATAFTLAGWMPAPNYPHGLCRVNGQALAATETLERWLK